MYLLDEPTTGLHFEDVAKLLDVLNRLVDLGNSVVVIEHNLDVIKTADWVLEMGPEAGLDGGYLVAAGTPEDIVAQADAWTKAAGTKGARTKATGTNGSTGVPTTVLRSHTGEALREVLAAGPHQPRGMYDFAAATEKRQGDVDIAEVGRDSSMPWEADGRRWHTVDRVGRKGTPCRWDGRILSEVVDRIQESGEFSETNWNSRTIVEITSQKKSDGWFMHAITGEEWLLKLKFRTAKNTFQRDVLIADLQLKPLNDLPDLPVYGHEPRVKCKNLPGPWQEIQLQVHAYEEIDREQFWKFLERAAGGFNKVAERVRQNPDDVMPWKVLGQKWHFARKGFPPGRPPQWDVEVLEELCESLRQIAAHGQMLWNNQQVIHVFVPEQREPWASLWTKRAAAVELVLAGPRGHFALGRIAELGSEREFVAGKNRDLVKLRFTSVADLEKGDLWDFVREHLASLSAPQPRTAAVI